MKYLMLAALVVALTPPLLCLSGPASAASAHNSQAGAYGPTSNNSARTYRHHPPKVMAPKS